jgi:hypothetical protein
MRNVQHRVIDAPPAAVGALLDNVLSPSDSIWPGESWPTLVLDNGLTPGSRGGHAPIHYYVSEYEPGNRLRFVFEPETGIDGYHEIVLTEEGPTRTRLTHTLAADVGGRMIWLWPLVIRWMHEALIHDLFDNAERAATGRLSRGPARWSPWVRLLRRSRGVKR